MTQDIFDQLVNDARAELVHYHLVEALFIIKSLVKEEKDETMLRRLQDEFDTIQRNYQAMLDYLAKGGTDENSEQAQGDMVRRTYLLLNKIDKRFRIALSGNLYNTFYQYCQNEPSCSLQLHSMDWEFYKIMLMDGEDEMWNDVLKNVRARHLVTRRTFVSAYVLSAWNYLDPKTIEALCIFAQKEPRAVTGLVMVAMRYEKELELFPDTLAMLGETMQKNVELVAQVNHDLIMTQQNEALEKRIKEEIMPTLVDMAKSGEEIHLGFDEDDDDDDFEKLLHQQQAPKMDDKTMAKKGMLMMNMMQLVDMHNEGLDMNSDIFNIASRHPFFGYVANWFMPFATNHPGLGDVLYQDGKPNTMLKFMFESGQVCDIDKYAMTLMMKGSGLKAMPIFTFVHKEVDEAEAVPNEDYQLKALTGRHEVTDNIRSLYRFFQKSQWKNQLVNLYEYSTNLLKNNVLRPIFWNNTKLLSNLGSLMSRYGNSQDALDYLKRYAELEGSNAMTLLQVAVCYLELKKFRQAADYLLQASLLQPDDRIVLIKLAQCYTQLHDKEQALECLEQLETLMPDSTKITTDTGLTLIQLGRYEDALKRFYKLEYNEKSVVPSRRAIAWCSFKLQKYETAMKYYNKIYKEPTAVTWEDYLNGGHTAWLMGNTTKAIDLYRHYLKLYQTDRPEVKYALDPYDKDSDTLLALGKSQRDIDLMHDILSSTL